MKNQQSVTKKLEQSVKELSSEVKCLSSIIKKNAEMTSDQYKQTHDVPPPASSQVQNICGEEYFPLTEQTKSK